MLEVIFVIKIALSPSQRYSIRVMKFVKNKIEYYWIFDLANLIKL